jgi:drug/metabolite transporter (DMT)-like permease
MVEPGVFAALSFAVLMAAASVFSRRGLQYAPFETMLFASLVVSAPVFVVLAVLAGESPPPFGAAGLIAVSGVIGSAIARGLVFSSYEHIGPGKSISIVALSPMLVALLAASVLGETLTVGVGAGTVLVVAGVLVLVQESSVEVRDSSSSNLVLLLPVVAAVLISFSVVLRKVALNAGVGPLTAASINATTALVVVGPLLAARRGRAAVRTDLRAVRNFGIASVLMTVAFALYFLGLQVTPASSFFPIVHTQPLFGVTFSALYLGELERITPRTFAGASVVVAGAVLVTLS